MNLHLLYPKGPPPTLRPWVVFNLVGFMGLVVQLASLTLLTKAFGINYLTSTAAAVLRQWSASSKRVV